jgi:hypothetical protein
LHWRETQRTNELLHTLVHERESSEAARDAERAEWGKERRELLNRVQRPENAVYEDFEPSREKAYVGFDDDDAWNALQVQQREETLT